MTRDRDNPQQRRRSAGRRSASEQPPQVPEAEPVTRTEAVAAGSSVDAAAILRAVLECTHDAVLVTDSIGRVIAWNGQYAALWDIPRSVLETAEHLELLRVAARHFDDPRTYLARVEEIYAGAPRESFDLLEPKDGRAIERHSRLRTDGGRNAGRIWIFRDVTGSRRAEAELRDADRRHDELLTSLVHEMRKPLAPILQATFVAQTPSSTTDEKSWSHGVIIRQVTQMSTLLDRLLDAAQAARGTLEIRKERTDLESIVRAAIEAARPSIETKRQTLTVELPDEPIPLAADPLRMTQLLTNLLANASKYSYFDGTIRLSARRSDSDVVLEVADDGIGISADRMPSIFTPFSRLGAESDGPAGGLGIGLALAKRIVELHGGTIEAASGGEGRGTELTLRLPRGDERFAPAPDEISAGSAPRKVLIADDNPDVVDTLAMLLRMDGHEVAVARDGRQALETFESFRPDVALLDIGMPAMSGYEVARRVRASDRGRRVKLVAVTGWGQERDRAQSKEAGFDQHFTKPLDPGALRQLMRDA